ATPTASTAAAATTAGQRRRRRSRGSTCGHASRTTGYSSSSPSATSARSSSVIGLPQPLERTRRARLHRPLRDRERLGHLRLRQAEEVPEGDDVTLFFVQLLDRRKHR